MALTVRRAQNTADLITINTLFTTVVNGSSIIDELIADYGVVMPFTLAVWQPMLSDPTKYILMAFDGGTQLRGAGLWSKTATDVWMVTLIGIDKSLTVQQRIDGLHDVFQANAASVPAQTKFGGQCKIGGRIDLFLRTRLPAANRQIFDADFALYRCTAAEAAQYL